MNDDWRVGGASILPARREDDRARRAADADIGEASGTAPVAASCRVTGLCGIMAVCQNVAEGSPKKNWTPPTQTHAKNAEARQFCGVHQSAKVEDFQNILLIQLTSESKIDMEIISTSKPIMMEPW
jgi:hypothetical protein